MTAGRLTHGARRLRGLLSVHPLESSTPERRGAERERRAALSAVVSVGARVLTVAISLITIPLTLGYLGPERFGVWITISSFSLLLAFADLGLGNGLVNLVAAAHGNDDRIAMRRAVSSAFFMLSGLAVVAAAIAAIAVLSVDWALLLNARSIGIAEEVRAAVAVFAACFVVGLPLGVAGRVQMGLQEGFASQAWAAAGGVFSLVAILLAIAASLGLPWLVLALFGGPVVAAILNSLWLFGRRRPWLRPSWAAVEAPMGRALLGLGGLFFLLQLAMAVAFHKDLILAANVVGPTAAAEYGVAYRLFMVVPTFVGMMAVALWPAYGEAITRGDYAWIRRTLARSLWMSFAVTAAASIVLLLAHDAVLGLWIGGAIQPPFALLAGMAVWAVLSTTVNAVAVLLNGGGIIKFQVVVAIVMAVCSLALSILLANAFGVSGVIWGTVIAFAACSAVPMFLYLPRALRAIERRAAVSSWPA